VVAIILIVAAARIAEPFLVPLVAGILLSYMLRPVVSILERARLPRLLSASLVMFALLAAVSASLFAIAGEFNDAVAALPAAARKLRHVAADLGRSPAGPVTNMKAAAAELDRAAAEATGKPARAEATTSNATTQVQNWFAEQSAQVATVVVQLFMAGLLTFFLLAAGDTFRRKVARLAGESLARRRVTVEVLNEIDAQIQRYMATLLVVNVLIAVLTWAALSVAGLANAGVWGVVTGVLHVIPYAGTLISAVAVGAAMLTESGNVVDALLAMGAVVLVAEAIGLLFATWLQGRTARMNPVATFVGVMFFGWLWGAWGLLLGMPILAVLNAISDRVEAMKPLRELLGT
jgi:predicted PurR-regulated permease PerM